MAGKKLTHFDDKGHAAMVDVSEKRDTVRLAVTFQPASLRTMGRMTSEDIDFSGYFDINKQWLL